MEPSFIICCPHCGGKNRIPRGRWGQRALCGKCRTPLPVKGAFPDRPLAVSDSNFREEVIEFPGPVLMEFFSPG